MFDEIFFPRTAEKHRAGSFAEEREQYLRHLKEVGTSRRTLRKCANNHLNLVRLLGQRGRNRFGRREIEAAAEVWSEPKGRRWKAVATVKARQRFISHGIDLLDFLGWRDEVDETHHPHRAEVRAFEQWLRSERGLSEATIAGYYGAADHFFARLTETGKPLGDVRISDIDDAIAFEHTRGAWRRRTICDYAERLRPFFAFAESRGWCMPGIAAGIAAPQYMADEFIPKGIRRDDVVRLLASVHGERPMDKRDRAILLLLVTYGLRVGEVAGLHLDDLDWENGLFRVRCPKPGRTHLWPLSQQVGYAIIHYIREARPNDRGRHLFFTSYAPIRPLSTSAMGRMVARRLEGIGVVTGRRGTHALRHAAAQHLLDQGVSMKIIGDFLGHRDPSSTAIYAKVDLVALREVAAFDLEGMV